jgi:predicted Kef-type K+ transport protein
MQADGEHQKHHADLGQRGRIAVGWLIVEDLAMVVALVLLPALGGALGGAETGGAPSWAQLPSPRIGHPASAENDKK